MISTASIQNVIAQVSHNFAAGQKFEKSKAIDEARLHYSLALASLEVLTDSRPQGQYAVAMPSLGVISAEGPNELFRLLQWLADVHDRIGRIDLARLHTVSAVRHLAAAQAGYEAITAGGIKSFEASVLLAEAHVRGGNGEAGHAAATAAVVAVQSLVDYCSPAVVWAYYWLYRSEAMTLRNQAASAAAARMLELLDLYPDVINSGTAGLLRREVSQFN